MGFVRLSYNFFETQFETVENAVNYLLYKIKKPIASGQLTNLKYMIKAAYAQTISQHNLFIFVLKLK